MLDIHDHVATIDFFTLVFIFFFPPPFGLNSYLIYLFLEVINALSGDHVHEYDEKSVLPNF